MIKLQCWGNFKVRELIIFANNTQHLKYIPFLLMIRKVSILLFKFVKLLQLTILINSSYFIII